MLCVTRTTRRTLAVFTLALVSCRGAMQSPTPTPEVVPLYFVTSSATHPLLRELSTAYSRDHALVAIIDQSSTDLTLEQALNPAPNTPFASSSYAITTYLPSEANFWAAPLGMDGIAVIVHPSLTIEHLTANELRSIFTGNAENWQAFGAKDTAITVVSHDASNPTRQAFDTQVLGQRMVTMRARLATTSAAMIEIVAETPGAIGYISMSLLDQRVSVVGLQSDAQAEVVFPTLETVASGEYPLQTPLLVIGHQAPVPGDGYYEFILWMQQGDGQALIHERYAPLPD